jgi:hypothetical protein
LQIASGLNPGDRVIASDTSSFGTAKRVTLR